MRIKIKKIGEDTIKLVAETHDAAGSKIFTSMLASRENLGEDVAVLLKSHASIVERSQKLRNSASVGDRSDE